MLSSVVPTHEGSLAQAHEGLQFKKKGDNENSCFLAKSSIRSGSTFRAADSPAR